LCLAEEVTAFTVLFWPAGKLSQVVELIDGEVRLIDKFSGNKEYTEE
jgi:hypothetical protein